MRFYDCATAPSPRRVRIFLAEKGITVPVVQVNLREGEHLQPAFRKINPEATVPALELDDGTVINDAIAICAYFEELHPEPPLIGRTPEERAVTIAWNRRIEHDGFYAVMEAFPDRATRWPTSPPRSRSSLRSGPNCRSLSPARTSPAGLQPFPHGPAPRLETECSGSLT